jgi:hypothetical protein
MQINHKLILNNSGRQHEIAISNINLMDILELVYAVLVALKFKTICEELSSNPCQFTSGISVAIFRNRQGTNTRTMMPTLILLLPVICERRLGVRDCVSLKKKKNLHIMKFMVPDLSFVHELV